MVAGGTLPEFGPDGALRRTASAATTTRTTTSIPNDFDPIDNDEPEDGTEPEDFEFDGRIPEGGRLPPTSGHRSRARGRTVDERRGREQRPRENPPSSCTGTSGGSSA